MALLSSEFVETCLAEDGWLLIRVDDRAVFLLGLVDAVRRLLAFCSSRQSISSASTSSLAEDVVTTTTTIAWLFLWKRSLQARYARHYTGDHPKGNATLSFESVFSICHSPVE